MKKLPESWSIRLVGEAFEVRLGKMVSPKSTNRDDSNYYIANYNVQWGRVDISRIQRMHFTPKEKEKLLLKAGDLLVCEGGEVGRTAIWRDEISPCYYQKAVHRLRPLSHEVTPEFMLYFMNFIVGTRALSDFTSRSSIAHLTREKLVSLPITCPPIREQIRIAEILSTWDAAIDAAEKLVGAKRSRKRSLMQRLLPGKQRLPQFAGHPWRELPLSEIFERVTRKNNGQSTNVVTISARRGFVRQDDFFKRQVASETLDNYFLVKKGEFCYNKSYSTGYDWGATKRLKDFDEAVVTTLYICFALRDHKKNCGDFFEHFFEAGTLNHGLTRIAHEGGRAHGLLNVTPSDFFNLKITVPDYDEQVAIARILDASDRELQLLESQLEALRRQKRGLMQQLLTGRIRVRVDEN